MVIFLISWPLAALAPATKKRTIVTILRNISPPADLTGRTAHKMTGMRLCDLHHAVRARDERFAAVLLNDHRPAPSKLNFFPVSRGHRRLPNECIVFLNG